METTIKCWCYIGIVEKKITCRHTGLSMSSHAASFQPFLRMNGEAGAGTESESRPMTDLKHKTNPRG